MIVSDLESLLARLMLGGVIAALEERRLSTHQLVATGRFLRHCEAGGVV